jgi:hypothetical protein
MCEVLPMPNRAVRDCIQLISRQRIVVEADVVSSTASLNRYQIFSGFVINSIGGDALSSYRSAPSGERRRGDREAAGFTLGQRIALAHNMATGWTEGSSGTKGDRQAAQIGLQATRQRDFKGAETFGH